ncbi:DUF3572 domain-containing protein [Rhizobiaceae bacterium BDR2-2]|uniref:DUF3572 domain-containing protein n=1 Tax=Ectorhizobium quercum TaxID=2965071 RepID=A0AAE3SXV7_9HYPH|nr:DUF3572 domain-containing protein [Ectorhizobium quercum]MCX8998905.1 DUF3572 domain-containing protein [Ectorhizobium quercum]
MISKFKNIRSADPEPEILALTILAWLSEEPELLSRFLALSGLQLSQIAAVAREPAFLGGVVDFLMGNEADLLRFAAATGTRPEAVGEAWQRLCGGGLDSGQI